MNKNYNPQRLLTWANHLLFAELKNEPYIITESSVFVPWEDGSFDFSEPCFKYCAQEIVAVFENWVETPDGDVFWIMDDDKTFVSSMKKFFGISEEAIRHIIIPLRQNLERFGGKILLNTSNEKDIAINILEMVKKIESYQEQNSNKIYLN